MSAVECPPTPPTLPEGDAALTPPPKSLEKSDSDESLAKSVSQRRPSSPDHDAKCAICLGNLDNLSHTILALVSPPIMLINLYIAIREMPRILFFWLLEITSERALGK